MIPVMQDKFGLEGNCFHACVASVLELELSSVPDFPFGDDDWFLAWADWLKQRGVAWAYFTFDSRFLFPEQQLVILTGPTPYREYAGHLHAVVARYERAGLDEHRFDYVHDPSPRGGFLKEPLVDVLALWPGRT